jgi:hypothetical protein
MCDIPLDLERRFERRWAARFAQPAPAAVFQKHGHEKQGQQVAAPSKAKKKTSQVEVAGFKPAPGVVSGVGI